MMADIALIARLNVIADDQEATLTLI